MKNAIISLVFVPLCVSCASLKYGKEYKSTEAIIYYENQKDNWRTLPTKEDVLNFRSEYFTVSEIDYAKIYGPDYWQNDTIHFLSPYDENLSWQNPCRRKSDSILDAWHELYAKLGDSVDLSYPQLDSIGGICTKYIIKHEKKDSLECVLYEDYRYNGLFSTGVGLAVSKDDGVTWNYYYTGLYLRQPIELKWYSKIPLIADENTFQIEAAMLCQLDHFYLPVGGGGFEVIKDGLVVTFDLNILSRDSDGDGLTDVLENKFRTDPYNPDTNGNGIADNVDANPRFNVLPSERTIIYQMLLDKEFAPITYDLEEWTKMSLRKRKKVNFANWNWPSIAVPFDLPSATNVNDTATTVLIISDDPALYAVRPQYARVIILTSEEYSQTRSPVFLSELDEISISPFFKIDNKKDQYILNMHYKSRGATYLIKRNNKGWKVEQISFTMS